jgi:hypothetical protein
MAHCAAAARWSTVLERRLLPGAAPEAHSTGRYRSRKKTKWDTPDTGSWRRNRHDARGKRLGGARHDQARSALIRRKLIALDKVSSRPYAVLQSSHASRAKVA